MNAAELTCEYALRLDRLEGRYIAYSTRKAMTAPMLHNIDCILESLLRDFISAESASQFSCLGDNIRVVERLLDKAEASSGITNARWETA